MRKNTIVIGIMASILLMGCGSQSRDGITGVELEEVTVEELPADAESFATSDEEVEVKTEFGSVTELFKETDPEWNESEEYTKAVSSY
jgi:hypothetical protein